MGWIECLMRALTVWTGILGWSSLRVGYCGEENERREYFAFREEFELDLENRDGESCDDVSRGNYGQEHDCQREKKRSIRIDQ